MREKGKDPSEKRPPVSWAQGFVEQGHLTPEIGHVGGIDASGCPPFFADAAEHGVVTAGRGQDSGRTRRRYQLGNPWADRGGRRRYKLPDDRRREGNDVSSHVEVLLCGLGGIAGRSGPGGETDVAGGRGWASRHADTRTPSCRRGHVLDQPGFPARTDVAVAVALGSGPGDETL